MIKKALSIAVLAGMTSFAQAEQERPTITLNLDYMSGGEKLVEMEYTDGSSDSVSAGAGIGFGAGLRQSVAEQVSIEGRLGYLSDTASGKDGFGRTVEFTFSTLPVDILAHYEAGKHSIGGGLTYHMNPSLDIDGTEFEFDNAMGTLIEYQYSWSPKAALSVKYQNISYDYEGTNFDGAGFGIGLSGRF
jgi:hypothetical protein